MKLSDNFDLAEFRCNDGTEVPMELYPNIITLAQNLQELRYYLKEPIHINSAYRTEAYNKKVGGKPKSMHLVAKAADITVKSKTPKQLAAIIEKLIAEKKMLQGGLGIYPGFVHYDVRGKKARW